MQQQAQPPSTRGARGPGRTRARSEHSTGFDLQHGFTLIELLVVMIIIGVLATIAIPVFISQRAKAHDAAAKADVSNLGKEVATYWVGGTGPLVLDYSTPGRISLTDGSFTTYSRLTVGSRPPASGASTGMTLPQGWCVALTDPQGSIQTWKYSALDGLGKGACP